MEDNKQDNSRGFLTEESGKPSSSRLITITATFLGFLIIIVDVIARLHCVYSGCEEVVNVARFDMVVSLFGIGGAGFMRSVFKAKYGNIS